MSPLNQTEHVQVYSAQNMETDQTTTELYCTNYCQV